MLMILSWLKEQWSSHGGTVCLHKGFWVFVNLLRQFILYISRKENLILERWLK